MKIDWDAWFDSIPIDESVTEEEMRAIEILAEEARREYRAGNCLPFPCEK